MYEWLSSTFGCYTCLGAFGVSLGILFVRCAWCQKLLGVVRSGKAKGGISDGMCRKCCDEMIAEQDEMFGRK